MKFIEVDNATDARIVIPQVRGADGRALTFEPKQQKVPVPQTCLSHPALIPYYRSTPPKLVPHPVAEAPVPAPVPKPMPKPPIAAPAPAPKVEAPAPPPEPVPESAPEPAPPPAEEVVPETEAPAPESISEAIEEHSTPKTGKKKKR